MLNWNKPHGRAGLRSTKAAGASLTLCITALHCHQLHPKKSTLENQKQMSMADQAEMNTATQPTQSQIDRPGAEEGAAPPGLKLLKG
jgi:hypothetical protein